jgi:hypothetical protein
MPSVVTWRRHHFSMHTSVVDISDRSAFAPQRTCGRACRGSSDGGPKPRTPLVGRYWPSYRSVGSCRHLIHAYRGYLGRVRGLAPRTVSHHATVTTDFLRFLRYQDRSRGLQDLRVAEIEAFITATGARANQWAALQRFVDDGRLAIDNNAIDAASGISARMPPVRLCRVSRASGRMERISSRRVVADAA